MGIKMVGKGDRALKCIPQSRLRPWIPRTFPRYWNQITSKTTASESSWTASQLIPFRHVMRTIIWGKKDVRIGGQQRRVKGTKTIPPDHPKKTRMPGVDSNTKWIVPQRLPEIIPETKKGMRGVEGFNTEWRVLNDSPRSSQTRKRRSGIEGFNTHWVASNRLPSGFQHRVNTTKTRSPRSSQNMPKWLE